MIFSKLFKTKINWQHKDATVRITAINDELSADNPEQLVILTELINQDSSDLVRRAALIKVGTFEHYLEASRNNSQEKVKQFAAKQIHDILTTDHSIVLSSQVKEKLLAEQEKEALLTTPLLEAWLTHEQNSALMISLYQLISQRKTSANLLIQSFTQKQNIAFQNYIIDQVTDVKLLEKLSKKACNSAISQHIQEKITAIQTEIEKPQKLTKQVQLTLAKLQALKDVSDYADYKRRKAALIKDWQTLTTDFNVLPDDEASLFNEKYQTITDYLDKLFIAKAEQYQQQIISDKLEHDKKQDKKEFTQQLNQISKGITTAVFSSDKVDDAIFKDLLASLTTDIKASVLNKSEQSVFINQVEKLIERLNQIPEIAESVSQATHLISKISQLTLPKTLLELNDRQQTYSDWLSAWRVIEQKTAGILPEEIVQAQKQIVSTWQSGLKSLQNQQKELFFQHKKKLQDIKRLLNAGKFKVCFGLFKGVKESIEQLSAQQQQQLQRDFDQVSEKMAELSDWEHYIATPRKQELLTSIQALVETPLDNPNEQAAKVKTFRSTWNSLGHADEDVDKELNEQFNQLCEQAFAPCRLFYAEQDKIREQHLVARQEILVKAKQLAAPLTKQTTEENSQITFDFKALEGQLNALQKLWSKAGEVDRNQYKKLQQQFRNATAPIQQAISSFQLQNAEAKQALIVKAEALIDNDDIFTAIESAKQLQKSWREIGFAGNQKENMLWQQFRETNDKLFAKRSKVKSEQDAALTEQQQVFETQLTSIETDFVQAKADNNDNNQALLTVKAQAEALLQESITHKPVIKSVAMGCEKVIKQVAQLIEQAAKNKAQQTWVNLFELMTLQAQKSQEITELQGLDSFNAMTSFWQKRFLDQVKLTKPVEGNNRFDKTLEIEILSNSESPSELANQRMKVQVQLMQEQMLSGNEVDLTQLLVDWLMLGTLSENDLPLIARLNLIYSK
ncbi:DUF349 domain-containing protein [Colwellia sp. E2M01]|uniref:DUF349 domain-containing protein n=1 Tax=Colwellia sp. E2M01 TaxID=2841561 RepID=UPI001C086968|nr:DUF349 domain-containing protein [Colwellia sp. E2M01]MBU2870571.1 DUF349 domain-containing protein [Colwellia sp. E2M01]